MLRFCFLGASLGSLVPGGTPKGIEQCEDGKGQGNLDTETHIGTEKSHQGEPQQRRYILSRNQSTAPGLWVLSQEWKGEDPQGSLA